MTKVSDDRRLCGSASLWDLMSPFKYLVLGRRKITLHIETCCVIHVATCNVIWSTSPSINPICSACNNPAVH